MSPSGTSSSLSQDFLYQLLPRFIRNRDFYQGQPLRALMEVLEGEYRNLWENIDDLYHDWFIETCDDWVVSFIGDLVGIGEAAESRDRFYHLRAVVGNSIGYRRRKGIPMIPARVVKDATGWPALAVEYSRLLVRAQSLARLHPGEGGSAEVRDQTALAALDGPFGTVAQTVDVRCPNHLRKQTLLPAGSPQGGNLPTLGLFVWRMIAYPLTRTLACEAGEGCYRFHPLGVDTRLFNPPRAPAHLTDPITAQDLPIELRREPLALEIDARRRRVPPPTDYFGAAAFKIFDSEGEEILPTAMEIADLGSWKRPEAGGENPIQVIVDPVLGRLTFPAGTGRAPRVSFSFGFSADLGGGPYSRTWARRKGAEGLWRPTQLEEGPADPLAAALDAWRKARYPDGLIVIADLGTERFASSYTLDLSGDRRLTLAAPEGSATVLKSDLRVQSDSLSPDACLRLDGLWIEGEITLVGGVRLELVDCTVRPPRAEAAEAPVGLTIDASEANRVSRVRIVSSIVGPIRHQAGRLELKLVDSILDGGITHARALEATAVAEIARTTVFGRIELTELRRADDVLFTAPVEVVDCSQGIVRHSYVPPLSRTPRRFRCQPDLALERFRGPDEKETICRSLQPRFTSRRYGDPGYAQLAASTPQAIRSGAESGAEMGAFESLQQPQREAALAVAVDEYVPYGMEAPVYYVT